MTGLMLNIFILTTILFEVVTSNQNIRYHVTEESNIGYFVGNVLTDSNLYAENVKFEITTIENNLFRVDKKNGKIHVANRIDRETICPQLSGLLDESLADDCQIQFSIHILGSWINVYIIIDDMNDNKPEFPNTHETIPINEDVSENQVFPLKLARDPDFGKNTVQSYELSGEMADIFSLKLSLPEEVSLVLKTKLDAEKIQEYQGELIACDKGHPNRECSTQKLTIIVKDANDNSPIFEKPHYDITLKESIGLNSPVLKVEATDKDQGNNGKLRYYLKQKSELAPNAGPQTADKTFYIDPNSGEIFLKSRLNAKIKKEYEFQVFASDYGEVPRKSSAKISITLTDENDHKPWIRMMETQDDQKNEPNTFYLKENSLKNTIIGFLKVGDEDLDENGQVNCNISENEQYFSFDLSNPANRIYDIRNKVNFDREEWSNQGIIPLTIYCKDRGNPPLSSESRFYVAIEDINEHKPYFSDEDRNVNLKLEENLPIGKQVYVSRAIDKDATQNVIYKICNDPKNLFAINNNTGQVTVQGTLDREEQDFLSFNIFACEEGQEIHQVDPSAIQTINIELLDVNDNKPELIELTEFTIPENQLAYSRIVGKITVQDLDQGVNGTVKFKVGEIFPSGQSMIDPEEIRKRFEIDTNTGEIKCTQKLDREEIDEYIVRIEMYDIGIPSLSNSGKIKIILIDENDNTPEWESVSIVPFISTYSNEPIEEWKMRYASRTYNRVKDIHDLGIFNTSASLLPGQKVLQLYGKDKDAPVNANITFHLMSINRVDEYDMRFLSDHHVDIHNQKEVRAFYLSYFDLDASTGSLTASSGPDSKGIDFGGTFEIKVSMNDNGHPSREALGRFFLQIMPPSDQSGAYSAYSLFFNSTSLSFNLIIIMIALTCLVSVCLLAAIFIVRKNASKESFLRNSRLQNGIIANKIEGHYSPGMNTLGNLSTVHKWAQDGLYIQNEPILPKTGYLSPVSLKTGYTTANSTYGDMGQFELGKQSNLNSNSSGSDNGVYFNINSPLIQQFPNDPSLLRNSDSPSAQQQANLRSFY